MRIRLRLRHVALVAAFASSACGLLGDGDTPDSGGQGAASLDSLATTDTSGAAAGAEPGAAAGPLDVAAAPPSAAAPATAQATETQEELSVEERLDRLLVGQEAINRRLDSLAIASRDSARSLAASGQVLEEASQRVQSFGVGVIWSMVVVALFNLAIRGLVWVLDALAERNASRRLFYKRLVPIVRIVLWIFAAYLIVSVIFEVDAQGLLAAAAAIGVAVGFAAQDLLKNLFGGLILVFDQPFQVGDKIRVGGTYGEVKSIGLRSTRIVTPDDNLVSVPNAMVVDQQVANANAGELNCQVVTDLYLPGWPNESLIKRIAFDAAASSKFVYLNKPIVVLVADEFQERFFTRVRVKAYVLDPRLEFLFMSDVTERARSGFREAGLLEDDEVSPGAADAAASSSNGSAEVRVEHDV
jgi:small-conductance mechanosensitive channel